MASDSNLPPEPPDGDDLPLEESPAEGPAEGPNEVPAPGPGRIVQQSIEDELKDSYLTYAMSVIVSRALPDVRDGLKPSQRRILVAMNDLSLTPGAGRVKCAKISGDTSGNYHPHGESVIYPTLVRMAQEWNMRHVLVDKQGNFGSIAGLAAGGHAVHRGPHVAHRRLDAGRPQARHGRLPCPPTTSGGTEPTVLPSKFPNLLVNGSNGIAVGMATSIPPHNLGEICDALIRADRRPRRFDRRVDGDRPRAGLSHRRHRLRPRPASAADITPAAARSSSAPGPRSRNTARTASASSSREIPFQQARDRVEERIAALVNEGRIAGISAIRNESDLKEPVRLVLRIEARRRPGGRAQPALPVLAAARHASR